MIIKGKFAHYTGEALKREEVSSIRVNPKEEEGEGDGFHWSFLCIQCVRDWRERGLKREGLSPEEVTERLYKEYPIK